MVLDKNVLTCLVGDLICAEEGFCQKELGVQKMVMWVTIIVGNKLHLANGHGVSMICGPICVLPDDPVLDAYCICWEWNRAHIEHILHWQGWNRPDVGCILHWLGLDRAHIVCVLHWLRLSILLWINCIHWCNWVCKWLFCTFERWFKPHHVCLFWEWAMGAPGINGLVWGFKGVWNG